MRPDHNNNEKQTGFYTVKFVMGYINMYEDKNSGKMPGYFKKAMFLCDFNKYSFKIWFGCDFNKLTNLIIIHVSKNQKNRTMP